jgi:glycosyltransferase involved in cell wall biosynthesis
MKILQITPAFYPAHVYGGPIQSIYHLCCHLARSGCEVRVLTTNANGMDKELDIEKRQEIEIEENLRVRYCKRILRHSVSPLLVGHLPRYVGWADVVHLRSVYSFPTIPTLLMCRALNKPLVWSPHGSLQRWSGSRRPKTKAIWEAICRAVAPRKMILHATCDEEAKESGKRFPKAEIAVIPHGIAVPEQTRHVEARGLFRLLYLGLLNPKKGIETLLAACKIIEERDELSWSLTIAGSGDPRYTEMLRAKIIELGFRLREGSSLSEQEDGIQKERLRNVHLVGHVTGNAKEELFENADILVLPSYTENFGMVVVEALAHGIPVVASTGTPWSRIEQKECGLWVHNDPESLANAIRRMKHLPLRKMGDNGRKWMQEEFIWQHRTQEMLQSYERLTG